MTVQAQIKSPSIRVLLSQISFSSTEALCNCYGGYNAMVFPFVLDNAIRSSRDYEPAFWRHYPLNNGGAFFAPDMTQSHITLNIYRSEFYDTVTCEAAGIICTLFAYYQLACNTRDLFFLDHYDRLMAFARGHREASKILAAIAA